MTDFNTANLFSIVPTSELQKLIDDNKEFKKLLAKVLENSETRDIFKVSTIPIALNSDNQVPPSSNSYAQTVSKDLCKTTLVVKPADETASKTTESKSSDIAKTSVSEKLAAFAKSNSEAIAKAYAKAPPKASQSATKASKHSSNAPANGQAKLNAKASSKPPVEVVDKKNVDASAKTNVDAVATTTPQTQHEASHEVITFSPEEMSSINDRINTSLFYPYTPPVNLITDSVFSYKKLNNGELDNLANEIRKKIENRPYLRITTFPMEIINIGSDDEVTFSNAIILHHFKRKVYSPAEIYAHYALKKDIHTP
jgi:hypothetical protein